MKNTGFDETNMTLYNTINLKKITRYQKYERTVALSAGGLKTSIYDLIILANNIPKLLNKKMLELFKKIYVINKYEDYLKLWHNGGLSCGYSDFKVKYDLNWKIQNIKIILGTGQI